jgi:hypothetical protein
MNTALLGNLEASAIHQAIITWINRIIASGGTKPTRTTIVAVDKFYKTLARTGLIHKMKSVNCMVPDNLVAATVPIVSTYGNTVWTNTNFIAGDLDVNGLKGNGSNKVLKTGVIPNTAFANTGSAGYSLYIVTGSAEAKKDIGCNAAGTYEPSLTFYPSYAGTCYWDAYYGNGSGRSSVAHTSYAGYISANRTANNATAVYKAKQGSAHASLMTSTTALVGATKPTIEVYVFAGNESGNTNAPSSKRLSFAAIHDGLTSTESSLLFDAVHLLRKELGGGWV